MTSESPLVSWRDERHVSLWIVAEETADLLHTRNVSRVAQRIRDIELGREDPAGEVGVQLFSALHDLGHRDAEQLRQAQREWYERGGRR